MSKTTSIWFIVLLCFHWQYTSLYNDSVPYVVLPPMIEMNPRRLSLGQTRIAFIRTEGGKIIYIFWWNTSLPWIFWTTRFWGQYATCCFLLYTRGLRIHRLGYYTSLVNSKIPLKDGLCQAPQRLHLHVFISQTVCSPVDLMTCMQLFGTHRDRSQNAHFEPVTMATSFLSKWVSFL